MSENNPRPEPRDRTALYIAIVGATATIIAAFITVLPNLLNRASPPPPAAPLVVTITPMPTQVSQAIATAPGTAGRIDFLVTNNRAAPYDFFIDNEYQITVPAGGYQLLRVIPGEHTLTHCPRGERPGNEPNECASVAREVQKSPFDWQLGGSIAARDKVLLFLLNQIDNDIDIYVNDTEMVPVNAHQMGTIQLEPGTHKLQACHRGITPAQGRCGNVGEFEFLANVEMFVVNVP